MLSGVLSMNTWDRVITKKYWNQFIRLRATECKKCGKVFKVNDVMIRHRNGRGKSSPYHDECYTEMYQ